MAITGEEQRDELMRVVLRLLESSWRDIGCRYDGLTVQERACLTREEHARLVLLIKHPRPVSGASTAQLVGQLVGRARQYAEAAIEGVDLEASHDDIGDDYPREAETRDMERVAASLASAFVVGYGAALDDLHSVQRLGGVNETGRKRGPRKAKR
jgi:hypothetical protein